MKSILIACATRVGSNEPVSVITPTNTKYAKDLTNNDTGHDTSYLATWFIKFPNKLNIMLHFCDNVSFKK